MTFFDFSCSHRPNPGAPLVCVSLVWIMAGWALSLSAAAQIMSAQERDMATRHQQELQRQQQQEQQQRQQLERSVDVRLGAPTLSVIPALPVEAPCFPIHRLEIKTLSGEKPLAFGWLYEQLTVLHAPDFLGQCLGAQGVAWLIDRAQALLMARGFVTSRILAPAQEMQHGVLTLVLIPGRIHAIRLTNTTDSRVNLDNALPMHVGDTLNLRDVEQALENLKRVPTAEADIQISPAQGDDAQAGDSDLLIVYRPSFPLRLTVGVDDGGIKSTGKYLGSVTVSYDNPLGLNDVFYVTNVNGLGGGDPGPRSTHSNTLHYSLPWGYSTLGLTSSTSTYYQNVAGLNQNYVYRGSSESNEIKFTHLLLRDDRQKFSGIVRAFQRRSNSYIDDTEVGVQRRVVGGWDGGFNHKISFQEATLESNATYKRGTGAFGAIQAPEEDFNEGTSRFALITADANWVWPFKVDAQRFRYSGTWRIQQNRTPLTPQDRFAIGGRYTVRGFDGESVLSAERGWLWRNDLGWALSAPGQELYAGMDTGQVGGASSDLLVGKRLTGAVLGLRGAIQKLSYDIFVATPVSKPDRYRTANNTAGFSLSMGF